MKKHRNNMLCAAILSLAGAVSLAPVARAHHGQDFILVEDYHVAAPGQFHLTTDFEWEKYPDQDHFGLMPALMMGVLPRTALSIAAGFRDEEDGWRYTNVTPAVHFQLTPPDLDFPVKVGLSVGYQFGDEAGEPAAEEAHEEHGGGHGGEHHAEHHHHHHEVEAVHHHSGSVHNHDGTGLVSRLSLEVGSEATKAVANVISFVEDGGDAAWGYAVGARHKFTKELALGVEAMGDFESDGWHEIAGAAYIEPIANLTLKLGAGFGLTEATPDFVLHTGFIMRF